ncbi:hypothetical protein [Streptomyces sp. NPDC004008]
MDVTPWGGFQRASTLWLPRPTAPAPVPRPVPKPPPPTIRMVGGRRMQCKDIADAVFLDAVRRAGTPGSWRMRWHVQEQLETVLGPLPGNLFMAKARKLIAARKMGGCDCGCRGDWHPADECNDSAYCCGRPGRTKQ